MHFAIRGFIYHIRAPPQFGQKFVVLTLPHVHVHVVPDDAPVPVDTCEDVCDTNPVAAAACACCAAFIAPNRPHPAEVVISSGILNFGGVLSGMSPAFSIASWIRSEMLLYISFPPSLQTASPIEHFTLGIPVTGVSS